MDYSTLKHIEFRRKFWKFFGAEIYAVDPATSSEVGYIRMKAWKLREDVRLFADRSMQREILAIHARNIIDLSATYDVIDGTTKQPFFSLKRKGLKSIFVRDHWDLLDTSGNPLGAVQETSGPLALVRRWIELVPIVGEFISMILLFVPQTYNITLLQADGSSKLAGTITHRKNPFIVKMALDTSVAEVPAHSHITMAVVSMLSIIEAAKG